MGEYALLFGGRGGSLLWGFKSEGSFIGGERVESDSVNEKCIR